MRAYIGFVIAMNHWQAMCLKDFWDTTHFWSFCIQSAFQYDGEKITPGDFFIDLTGPYVKKWWFVVVIFVSESAEKRI